MRLNPWSTWLGPGADAEGEVDPLKEDMIKLIELVFCWATIFKTFWLRH
jgi:hypothetical protein